MPKMNVDEQKQIAEPIEITLDGQEYKIEKITDDMLKQVSEISKKETAKGKDDMDMSAPRMQLAVFLGVEAEVIRDVDMRKIGKALEFITSCIEAAIASPKKLPEAGTK